jgi:hypothetical protein
LLAGVAGLSKRPLAWRRTPKFALESTDPSPFASTMPETLLGGLNVLLAVGALTLYGSLGGELALLTALGFTTLAFRFFCAPYMAAMAIRHARHEIMSASPSSPASEPLAICEATA